MWAGVTVGAAIIFVFWLWSLTVLLSQSPKANNENDKALQGLKEIKKEMPGLWQSLSAGISNVIDAAKTDLNSSPSFSPSASQANQPAIERLPIEQ